ncbi:MAG TPA: hypothetical protein VF725_10395 [Ktedonobacterales bacterium]
METKLARKPSLAKLGLLLLLSVALPILGCSLGATSSGGSSTNGGGSTSGLPTATATTSHGSGPTATPAPASAPPHAFAWFQYDSHHAPQIWASLNGASPIQITHIGPPSTTGCNTEVAWSPPVFSPNLTHIVASLGSFGCGDGNMYGPVSIITVSNGAISTVPNNSINEIRTTQRDAGWLDNSNIWFINQGGSAYTYHIGAGSASQLLGISSGVEGAVRGSTLFWDSVNTSSTSSWPYTLRRYNLGTHSAISGTVSLGAWGTCQCSPGDFHTPGWDASPDGSHIAYQVVTAKISPSGGIASSHIYYANADGSGASHIAQYMVTNQLVKMQFSPDGQWLAFTNALPSPATLSASVSSPGGSGDPTFHGYSPDTYNYPVWKWDSSQFWAGTIDAANTEPGVTTGVLYRFTRGGSGVVGVSGGYNPWYTIGG